MSFPYSLRALLLLGCEDEELVLILRGSCRKMCQGWVLEPGCGTTLEFQEMRGLE